MIVHEWLTGWTCELIQKENIDQSWKKLIGTSGMKCEMRSGKKVI